MTLKICELVSIVLSALVMGVFWGPWVGLSRSMSAFPPDVFLAIVHRMGRNLGPLMTVLMPVALASVLPVLVLAYPARPATFGLTAAGLACFLAALWVTMRVEVPLVTRFAAWTVATLPADWQPLRDRWGTFHILRVAASLVGLTLLVSGAIF